MLQNSLFFYYIIMLCYNSIFITTKVYNYLMHTFLIIIEDTGGLK